MIFQPFLEIYEHLVPIRFNGQDGRIGDVGAEIASEGWSVLAAD